MKVAVTGGAGFIGGALVAGLVRCGHQAVVLDVRETAQRGVQSRVTDVLDFEQVKESLEGVDVVFHLAGPVLEFCRRNPHQASTLQMAGTLNVLEACRLQRIRKIVLASSFYVYDGLPETMIVNESSPLDITRMELFGAIKFTAEKFVQTFAAKYGLEYVIFRFGSAYGWGNCSNVVKTFLERGWRGETIEVWGKGFRRNQYTYFEDIAWGCVLGMDRKNEIYNLISPEETSTAEVARFLCTKFGFDVVFDEVQKEGPSLAYMSPRKAMQQLAWRPLALAEGIEKMARGAQEKSAEKASKPVTAG
jgi:UDP-glucose 4-epimerase